jgi:hypothetical protein
VGKGVFHQEYCLISPSTLQTPVGATRAREAHISTSTCRLPSRSHEVRDNVGTTSRPPPGTHVKGERPQGYSKLLSASDQTTTSTSKMSYGLCDLGNRHTSSAALRSTDVPTYWETVHLSCARTVRCSCTPRCGRCTPGPLPARGLRSPTKRHIRLRVWVSEFRCMCALGLPRCC